MTQLISSITFIEFKICEIMRNIVKDSENIPIALDSKLLDMGIDSLIFIEMIVEIENEFGIEFVGDKLNQKEFDSVQSLVQYVYSLL